MVLNRRMLEDEFLKTNAPPYIFNYEIVYLYDYKELKYVVRWDRRKDLPVKVAGRFVSSDYKMFYDFPVREVHVAHISDETSQSILEEILSTNWMPAKKDSRKKVSYRVGNHKVGSKY